MTETLTAMVLERPGEGLRASTRAVPEPGPGQILVRVLAGGVCRTDLHVVDGEIPDPKLPVVPGHEVVGDVAAVGLEVERYGGGERVGVPWLGWTCGECKFCQSGRENLCERAQFTGYTLDGATPSIFLLTSATVFRFTAATPMLRRRRSFVPV